MSIIEKLEEMREESGLSDDRFKSLVAHSCGYARADKLAEMYAVHGLHPIDALPLVRKAGLQMPWNGLRCELIYTHGMKPSSADALIVEAKRFEVFVQ